LDHPKDIRDDNILSMMVLLGLDNIGDHFAHPQGRWTWSMRRENNYRWSKMDYILVQELYDFKHWAIKIPQVDTDHRAIIAEMKTDHFYLHQRYTTCQQQLPNFPFQYPLSDNDIRFQYLKEFKNEIPDLRRQRERSWISKPTWD
jgi:hypothetical protein